MCFVITFAETAHKGVMQKKQKPKGTQEYKVDI